jgi:hypothetical protein
MGGIWKQEVMHENKSFGKWQTYHSNKLTRIQGQVHIAQYVSLHNHQMRDYGLQHRTGSLLVLS